VRRPATALLAVGICAGCGSSHAAPLPLQVRNAYLGLHCRSASPCARLGIAVWLKQPESRVTITIHGRRVVLATHYGRRRDWIGFVHDPVAERLAGEMNRNVRLTVEATGRDGTIHRATVRSPVSPGWG
jgi:hypothetical protein